MRSVIVLLLSSLAACSASEGANRGMRCDVDRPCPSELVCYRNFCIPGDGPIVDIDASGFGADKPVANPDASQAFDASSVVGLGDIDAAESLVPVSGDDAQVPPVDDADAEVVVVPVEDAAVTLPAEDAGSAVKDAGKANASALIVCLPSCANRSFACLACLRTVLQSNPEVCSEASASTEPGLKSLCEFLCTNEACGG